MTGQQESLRVDADGLLPKLLVLLYSAGGYFTEGKTARGTVLSISWDPRFKGFLGARDLVYDGRFFGLLSSKVENAFTNAFELGYIEESYHARNGEPIHNLLKLTKLGERTVESILSQPRERENLNLNMNLKDLYAETLAANLLPSKFTLAYSLYLSHVVEGVPAQIVESRASPNKLYHLLNPQSVPAIIRNYFGQPEFGLIVPRPPQKIGDRLRIAFGIREGFIRKRYAYITTNEDQLKAFRSELEEHANDEHFLTSLARDGLFENEADDRALRVRNLIQQNDIQKEVVASAMSKLNILLDNFSKIQERGYDYVFGILERIARFSEEHIADPALRLEGEFTFDEWSTVYQIMVPAELKNEIGPHLCPPHTWHYGLDFHIAHIPQFMERAYLYDIGLKKYVEASREST